MISELRVNPKDVIRVNNSADSTYLVEDLRERVYSELPRPHDYMVKEGMSCQVLSIGGDWKQGKLKMIFVFEYEEYEDKDDQNNDSESPLDDIRSLER